MLGGVMFRLHGRLLAPAVRLVSTSAPRQTGNIPAGYGKLKDKQKMFNIDNGLR